MSQPLLLGPVTLDDGYLYEMDAIKNWFKTDDSNRGDEKCSSDDGKNSKDNASTHTSVKATKKQQFNRQRNARSRQTTRKS